jgi:hydroxymethylpyrimidine pyrophosphatase-like HAD family hydrolase
VNRELVGEAALAWADLGAGLPAGSLRLVLADIDGVITRGEGQSIELDVIERLAAINAVAQRDPCVPAIALCTGRQAPYVELMAQLIGTFLPCIFEHGAGLFLPTTFRFEFEPPDYAAQLARLRAVIDEPLIKPGRAFVQPGKEATMTLYPLGTTSVADLFQMATRLISDFDIEQNVHGVEVRPQGINKGVGAQRVAAILGIPLKSMVGVGDSDPDLSYLTNVAFSAAPANATAAVRQAVNYVAEKSFGAGLLEIVTLVERRNRKQTLTER